MRKRFRGWDGRTNPPQQTEPRDGLIGAFLYWLGGFEIEDGLTADLSEREMRRIRARQIDAVTRLVPITMTINVANAGIILFVFWNAGSNFFLGLWALAIASYSALATRSWARLRPRPTNEASPRATRRMTVHAFILALAWGAMAVMLLSLGRADASIDCRLPDGGDDLERRFHVLDRAQRRAVLHLDDVDRVCGGSAALPCRGL